MRLRTSVIAIIAVVLAITGGWAISRTSHDARAPLAQALDVLPADTRVAGFTDWAQIRSTLSLGRVTTANGRDTLVGNAFKRDLSARSILESFTTTLVTKYGWSIAVLRWESVPPCLTAAGQFGDVLTLASAHTTGPNATLDFDARKGSFMDGNGPLLFAACSS